MEDLIAIMSYPQPYTNFGEAKLHKLVLEAPGVLRVSFNRGKVNAWTEPMWRELDAIFRFIARDPDVNAVVLTGENRCFTAGLDCEYLGGRNDLPKQRNLTTFIPFTNQ